LADLGTADYTSADADSSRNSKESATFKAFTVYGDWRKQWL